MTKGIRIIYNNQLTQTISVTIVERTLKSKTIIETTWKNGRSIMKQESIYVEHYIKQRPFTADIIADYERTCIRRVKRILAGKESIL